MRNLILIAVFVVTGSFLSVNIKAEDAEKKIVKGELLITMNDEAISKIVLKKVEKFDDEQIVTMYIVKLDDTSKKMAKEMKGKEVEVEGIVVEVEKGDDVENHLTVQKYKEAEAKKAVEKDVDLDIE